MKIPSIVQYSIGLILLISYSAILQGILHEIHILANLQVALSWYRVAGLPSVIGWFLLGVLISIFRVESTQAVSKSITLLLSIWLIDLALNIYLGFLQFPVTSEEKFTLLLGLVDYFPWFLIAPISAFILARSINHIFPKQSKPLIRNVFSERVCPFCQTIYNSNPQYCYVCGHYLDDSPNNKENTPEKENEN